jgi:hypothetical protein
MTAVPLAAKLPQIAAIFPQFTNRKALLAHIAGAARILKAGQILPDLGSFAVNGIRMCLRQTGQQRCGGKCGDQDQLSHQIAPLRAILKPCSNKYISLAEYFANRSFIGMQGLS